MSEIRSLLKPEGSVMGAVATMGLVFAVYEMNVGPIAQAHASDPNHPSLESSRKKAGWISLALVSALTLITKDGNIGVLGYGSIIGMEVAYRHAIMTNPDTGYMQAPVASLYQPAQAIVPQQMQGQPALGVPEFAYAG